jgi:hypothetical protein
METPQHTNPSPITSPRNPRPGSDPIPRSPSRISNHVYSTPPSPPQSMRLDIPLPALGALDGDDVMTSKIRKESEPNPAITMKVGVSTRSNSRKCHISNNMNGEQLTSDLNFNDSESILSKESPRESTAESTTENCSGESRRASKLPIVMDIDEDDAKVEEEDLNDSNDAEMVGKELVADAPIEVNEPADAGMDFLKAVDVGAAGSTGREEEM